jgi:hypothetical protein
MKGVLSNTKRPPRLLAFNRDSPVNSRNFNIQSWDSENANSFSFFISAYQRSFAVSFSVPAVPFSIPHSTPTVPLLVPRKKNGPGSYDQPDPNPPGNVLFKG